MRRIDRGIAKAALAYWVAIFALGFVLGTVRVLWIAPGVGETGAVLMELPVMLGASWLAARWLVRRLGIGSAGQALVIGALGLAGQVAFGVMPALENL